MIDLKRTGAGKKLIEQVAIQQITKKKQTADKNKKTIVASKTSFK